MKRKLIVVTCCTVLAILFFWNAPAQRKQPERSNIAVNGEEPGQVMLIQGQMTPAEIEIQRLKRAPVLQEWLESIEEVLKTKDERAIELLEALKVGVLSMPVESGIMFLEAPSNETVWIAVTPVLPEDMELGSAFQQNGLHYAGASFSPETNVLILFNQKMSKAWKGILFLHELDHADRYFRARYNWKDIRTFCHEEMKVHEDQNRWVSKIGGKPYDDLVDAEVARQKKILLEKNIEIGTGFAEREDYNPALDKIFGVSLSKQEKDLRMTQIWIHAQFKLVESIPDVSTDARNERKAMFLKTVYAQGGILEQFNK